MNSTPEMTLNELSKPSSGLSSSVQQIGNENSFQLQEYATNIQSIFKSKGQ